MILHGYCVRRAGEPLPEPGLRGISGAEVSAVEEGGVAAWVSRLASPPAPEPERLREHDGVVRAALRGATPLPLRFGATFPDEGALRSVLAARWDELLASLARVDGRVEMGVAVGWDLAAARGRVLAARPELGSPEERPATGRAYLEARRREHALEAALREAAEALLDRVSRAVAEAVGDVAERRTTLPRPEVAGTLAHLVHRTEVPIYREAVQRASGDVPGAELRVSGPWAPYSFA